eukprot:scaffold9453_cov75-Skeletonema_menzelii.AAC.1
MLRNWLETGGRRQAPPAATSRRLMTAGREQCPFCFDYFSPQGLPGHVKFMHANEKPPKKIRTEGAKVKLRTENADGTFTTLTAEESELLLLREQGLAATIEPLKKTMIEEVPEKEVVELLSSDEELEDAPPGASTNTGASMNTGKTLEDERDHVAEGREEEEEACQTDAPTANESHSVRGMNWRASQKAAILKLWDDNVNSKAPEFVTTLGKKRFCRYIETKFKRKLQPNKLRDWIEKRDEIMASAKLQYADRRRQSAPRESVGLYADMEIKLAQTIRGMRQIGYVVETLTPCEKRVIITKAIGDCHAKLTSPGCKTYWRAFIATGSWMPVYHMFEDATSNEVPVEETQVSLQHLPDYDYKKRCSNEKVADAVKVMREEKDNAAVAERARLKKIADGLALEIASTQVFVDKADGLMPQLLSKVNELVSETLQKIHEEKGHERFIIGGSWAAAIIAKSLDDICADDDNFDACSLTANDIDVYFGDFTEDFDSKLIVDLNCIRYTKVDSITLEVNTIKCSNLSPQAMLANNDINVTACCFHVDFSKDELVSIHASPCFWEFLFQNKTKRTIRVVKPYDTLEYGATTLVRLAYKAFDLDFPFTFGDLTPDDVGGTIAESQKVKIDQMERWHNNPFITYACKKEKTYYKLVKKHSQEKCVKCLTKNRNKKCNANMCKPCCAEHGAPTCSAHKKKQM